MEPKDKEKLMQSAREEMVKMGRRGEFVHLVQAAVGGLCAAGLTDPDTIADKAMLIASRVQEKLDARN